VTTVTWSPALLDAHWLIRHWICITGLPWLSKNIAPYVLSCAAGSLGGLVNNTITARRTPPLADSDISLSVNRGWQQGPWADVFFGAVIGLITCLGEISDVPMPKILVTAILGSGSLCFPQVVRRC
jgi:hypothetical protein